MKITSTVMLYSVFVVLPAYSSESANNDHSLEFFLKNPTKETFLNWKEANDATPHQCQQQRGFDNEKRAALFDLIRNGNVYSLQTGMLFFYCWSGGELGDFNRSAGLFFDQYPQEFMRIVHDQKVPEDAIERMISMLPLELVDNINGKVALIERRINILAAFKEPSLQPRAQRLIRVLEENKTRLERVRAEIEAAKN